MIQTKLLRVYEIELYHFIHLFIHCIRVVYFLFPLFRAIFKPAERNLFLKIARIKKNTRPHNFMHAKCPKLSDFAELL